MGDRAQVKIASKHEESPVYLYTHWGATELIEIVRRALKKKKRWDDFEYLARIIFCEMVRGDEDGETGFGIGTCEHGDIWRLITLDLDDKTVCVKDYNEEVKAVSFEEFIQQE